MIQFKSIYLLGVVLLAGALTLGIQANVEAHDPEDVKELPAPKDTKKVPETKANARGCYVPDGDTLPITAGILPPCSSGVPVEGAGHEWKCPVVGQSPNQTCHWAFENRLGCENGGASKMCDTVAAGGGGTECKCVNP